MICVCCSVTGGRWVMRSQSCAQSVCVRIRLLSQFSGSVGKTQQGLRSWAEDARPDSPGLWALAVGWPALRVARAGEKLVEI